MPSEHLQYHKTINTTHCDENVDAQIDVEIGVRVRPMVNRLGFIHREVLRGPSEVRKQLQNLKLGTLFVDKPLGEEK